MFYRGPVKDEFSQSTYQMLPYWKSWSSKNKSIRNEALVEEVHETDPTEFIKYQTLASSDRNLTGFNTNSKKTTNGFLVSRSLPLKCTFILHRHHAKHCKNPLDKKNSDLVKEFKNIAFEPGCFWSWCWITNSANGNSRLKNTNKLGENGSVSNYQNSYFRLGSEASGSKIE